MFMHDSDSGKMCLLKLNKLSKNDVVSLSSNSSVIVIIGNDNYVCLPVKAVGYEEGGKRECAPLPYASIVRNPSIKKEIVNITVIIGVKDLVGDTYFDGEGAYDSGRQEIMKMFMLFASLKETHMSGN